MKTCTVEDCDRPLDCKGMCHMHYVRTRPRTPDKPKLVACMVCGTEVMRHTGGGRKYGRACSDACKQILRVGAKSELHELHWARMYGASCAWKAPADPYTPVAKMPFTCQWCGAGFESHQSFAKYCSKACVKRRDRQARRAREHNAPGRFTWTELTKLWVLFDRSCAYCGEHTALVDTQAEHVHPLSKGGRNDIGNILPSCARCNCDKRDVLVGDWNADRLRRGLKPVRAEWDARDAQHRHLVPSTHMLTA